MPPCFTLSEAGVGHDGFAADPPDLQSYGHILSVILVDLGKSELLVRDLPKPRSFWELDQEVQVKPGAEALNIDPDMLAELAKAFQEPSTTAKVLWPTRSRWNCHCLYLLKWRRRWSNRLEISGPWALILTSAEPWKCLLSRQWRPGGLGGI